MSTQKTIKRLYDSSRRKESARQTRFKIIEAARSLFIARGYSGATMEAIAQAAGVATETVYATFGNKRSILSSLMGVSLVGDDDPTPLFQRFGPQAVVAQKDQHRQLLMFAQGIAEIMARAAPLFEVMRAAAKSEADIAEMQHSMLSERANNMKFIIDALLANGPLKEVMDPELAAETAWALTSGEVYTLLVNERGWTAEKYVDWLAKSLSAILLQ